MKDFNNLEEIKKLDPGNVLESVQSFPDQCLQIWNDLKPINIQATNIKNIVICAMGASAYGGYITNTLFANEIKIPLYVVNDYHLPDFADSSTLVLLTSYSGTTEEVLSCAKETKEKIARLWF